MLLSEWLAKAILHRIFCYFLFSTDAEPGLQATQRLVLFTTGTGSTAPIYNAD